MRRRFVPIVVVMAAAAACGGGGDDGGAFVRGRLASVPAAAAGTDTVQITVTDLARLAELSGLPGPTADRTGDDLTTWTGQMTFGATVPGSPKLIGFLPSPVGSFGAWSEADDVRAATGIALGAAETMITVDSPPSAFTVMTGDLELDDSLTEVAEGVVSYGDGDDLSIGEPTPWNQVGAPIRFADRDGGIAWSRTTDAAIAYQAGSDPSLADDPVLGALAGALDDHDVVSAVILTGNFASADPSAATDVPPFTAVAVGVTVIEDEARTIVAYAFADDAAASDAVGTLAVAWADGVDADGRPIGEQFAVLDGTTAGRIAVIELVPVGSETTQGPGRLLFTQASVFRHP